jgi:hypothetical protein
MRGPESDALLAEFCPGPIFVLTLRTFIRRPSRVVKEQIEDRTFRNFAQKARYDYVQGVSSMSVRTRYRDAL